MKSSHILAAIFILAFFQKAYSQLDQSHPQNLSEIIFYRLPGGSGPMNNIIIYSNRQPVAEVKYGAYTSFVTPAGDYLFSGGPGNSAAIRIHAEAGRTCYVRCDIVPSFISSKVVLVLMEPSVGRSEISQTGVPEKPGVQYFEKERRSRLGMIVGAGFGFESIPLFLLQNGDEVTLSAGGGFSWGAQYTIDVNKKFNLAFDCFYQGSMLSTTLTNGDGTFDRMGLTITPSLIIPIKGGEIYRLMAGAGAGVYSFGSMYIDQSQVQGLEYTIKYASAPGYHLSMVFHAKFKPHAGMSMGIKYYGVHYKYKESGSTVQPNDPLFMNPDGSGFDFTFGYHLIF